MILPTSFK